MGAVTRTRKRAGDAVWQALATVAVTVFERSQRRVNRRGVAVAVSASGLIAASNQVGSITHVTAS